MKEHPTTADLRTLVTRSLDPQENEQALLEHLEWCDECFQTYEVLWARSSGDLAGIREAFVDSATSLRLEGRLFHRIHASSLGTESTWLATEGFLRVVVGVLLPILDYESAPTKRA